MGNSSRTGCGKFFRGLIAASRPDEIEKIVERYNKDAVSTEEAYMDLLLASGGSLNYQDIMMMPVDSISMLIRRINKRTEDTEMAAKQARNRR